MTGICRRAATSMLFALIAVVIASGAGAEGVSAQAFVEAIYKPYLKRNFKGIEYSKAANLRRYFEPNLANAIVMDIEAAKKRGEVPTLDGDPFIDAQEWQIADLAIDMKAEGATKALATIKFTNMREPKVVTLDLVKTSAGWRIAEIRSPSGSLRKLFKLKESRVQTGDHHG